MTMTDPIADMLTRLRNANQAYHETTSMPHSKIKVGIAEILKKQGYIGGFEVLEPAAGEVGKTLTLTLKYGTSRERPWPGCVASPSRACGSTPRRPRCPRCWAAWGSPSFPPPKVC